MRRRLLAAIVFLAALTPAMVGVQAIQEPEVDVWLKDLDPWSRVTTNLFVEAASDGDVGAVFQDSGDSLPYFAVSRDGSLDWTVVQVNATHTTVKYPAVTALPGDVWIIVYGGPNSTWYVYQSLDDGASWTQVQAVSQAWASTPSGMAGDAVRISLVGLGQRFGVVVLDSARDVRWYRSSDNGATWDAGRENLLISTGLSSSWSRVEAVALSDTWIDIYVGGLSGSCSGGNGDFHLRRMSSEDGGAFWGSAQVLVSAGTFFGTNCAAGNWDVAGDSQTGETVLFYSMGASFTWQKSAGQGDGFTGLGSMSETTEYNFGTQEVGIYRGVPYWFRSALYKIIADGSRESLGTLMSMAGQTGSFLPLAEAVHVFGANAGVQNRLEIHSRGVPAATVVAGGDFIWCSAIGDENGAYDYLEDVDIFQGKPAASASTDSGFEFTGNSGDLAYAAKSWGDVDLQVGSQHVEVWARIEALTEGTTSVFRMVLSTVPASGIDGVPQMDKGSGAGVAGFTGGMFAEHVEVQFTETGNDWNVQVMYVDGGQDRKQIGSSWVGGSPNTPSTFSLESNTEEGWISVQDATGQSLKSGSAEMNFTLPGAFSWSGTGPTWKNYWFVGYGTNSFLTAQTYVSDNVGLSTCVYDHACVIPPSCYEDPDDAPGVNGAPGRLVGNDELTEDFITGGGGDGNLDNETVVEVYVPGVTKGKGALGEQIPGAGHPVAVIVYQWFSVLAFAAVGWRVTGGRLASGEISSGDPIVILTFAFVGMGFAVPAFGLSIAFPLMTAIVAVALLVNRFWGSRQVA